ncbi:hypothetical protein L6R52_13170 [Myxococcota bacterium]|nr:hypothetical protein [Myxococcota bacterium]
MGITASTSVGCPTPPDDPKERVAAQADLTTRQLIAALNAKSRDALAPLVVVTSTTGGPPRALRSDERARLAIPDGTVEYLGAGKPGEMLLRDATGAKRSVTLVEVGGALKALATSDAIAPGLDVRVLTVLRDAE